MWARVVADAIDVMSGSLTGVAVTRRRAVAFLERLGVGTVRLGGWGFGGPSRANTGRLMWNTRKTQARVRRAFAVMPAR